MPYSSCRCLVVGVLVCPFLLSPKVLTAAQSGNETKPDEIEAVFRISKAFLGEVTDRPIVASIPFRANVLKFQCRGVIEAEGRLAIELQRSGQHAVFAVHSQGNAHACVRGVRGPLVAHGAAWGPFESRTIVHFDGRRFVHRETIPHATVCAEVQRVTGRRDRRIGRIVGAGILPVTDKLMPKALAQATPIANGYLQGFVEETADEIISALNQSTPVEESVHRLFPRTKDWVFQVSADEEFLQAAYGPPGASAPRLPELAKGFADVRFEAWLRSTSEEAQLLSEMNTRPLAGQLIQRYLDSALPELAALAEERSVDAVDGWVVIRFGAAVAE